MPQATNARTWQHFGRTLSTTVVWRGREALDKLERALGVRRVLELQQGQAEPTLDELFTISRVLSAVVYLVSDERQNHADVVPIDPAK